MLPLPPLQSVGRGWEDDDVPLVWRHHMASLRKRTRMKISKLNPNNKDTP